MDTLFIVVFGGLNNAEQGYIQCIFQGKACNDAC